MPQVERLFDRPELRDATDFDVTLIGSTEAFTVNAFVHGISQLFSSTDNARDWAPIAAEVQMGVAMGRVLGLGAGVLLGSSLAGWIGGPIGGLAAFWSAVRRQQAAAPVAMASVIDDVKRVRGLDVQIREVATNDSPVAAVLGVYGTGSAVITINANLSADWKRYVIAKELAHLMIETEGSTRVTTPLELEQLLLHLAAEPRLQQQETAQRQLVDQLLALEILFPQALRASAFASIAEGRTSVEELSRALIVPPQMVELARALTSDLSHHFPGADTALLWPSFLAATTRPPPVDADVEASGPVQRLLAQGGGALSLLGVCDRLGCSLDQARALIAGGDVFAIRGPDALLAPADQFLPNKSVVPGLKAVLTQFVDRHPVIALQFLVTPDSVLEGQSPLQALAKGGAWIEAVERLSRAHQGDGFA